MQPVKLFIDGQFRAGSTREVTAHIDPTRETEVAEYAMRQSRI